MRWGGRIPTDLGPEQLEQAHCPGPPELGRQHTDEGAGAADFRGVAGPPVSGVGGPVASPSSCRNVTLSERWQASSLTWGPLQKHASG